METSVKNQPFTYHKKSGYTGFIIAMICVCLVETVGVSYLLYKWSPVLHWIHLFLSVSTILFLILDLRVVTKNLIILQNEELIIKVGLHPAVHIQLSDILEIKSGKLNFENDRKNKEVLDLSLLGFDEPTFEIVLSKPIHNKNKSIQRIFITVDDERAFYELVNQGRENH